MAQVLLENLEHVSYVILNTAHTHNRLTSDLLSSFNEMLSLANNNKKTGWIVIKANGKNFCAGADLNWLKNSNELDQYAKLLKNIYNLSKPVVVYVHGATLAGAIGVISAADIVIADQCAVFGLPEVNLGLLPAMVSPYLIEAIGYKQALRLAVSAQRIDANEALSIGLVHAIYSYAEFMNYIENLKAASPAAIKSCKNFFKNIKNNDIDDQLLDLTVQQIIDARNSKDAKLGIESFFSKKNINWYQNDT